MGICCGPTRSLSWIPVLLVLSVTEPPAAPDRAKKRARALKEMLSTTLVRDAATRLVLLNLVAAGTGGLVMIWTNQKYWQESGVPLAYFGVLYGWLQSHLRLRREIRRSGEREIWPATFARRGRRVAHHRVFRDGVFPRLGRGIARDPGPGRPGPGRGALPECAQREDFLRVPRDRDLHGESGNPRLLLVSWAPSWATGSTRWGLPSVLSALGILFSIAFVFLLLPLVLSPADRLRA